MKNLFKSNLQFLFVKVILIVSFSLFFSFKSKGQSVTIIGPTIVCPNNFEPNGTSGGHNYSAQAKISGIDANCETWLWFVYKDGVLFEEGFGNNFNYNFPDTGDFTITFAGSRCGLFSATNVLDSILVTSRVKMPNPITGPNMCVVGEAYSYTSSPPLGLDDQTCFYHYENYWTAPSGWSINGGGNTFFGFGNSVNITAPSNTPSGAYTISMQSTIPNGLSGPAPNNRFLSLPRNYTVQIGPYSASQVSVSGTPDVCNGSDYTYRAEVPGGHQTGYTYNWVVPSGWIIESLSANLIRVYIPLNNTSYGQVSVSVNNGCGSPTPFTGITTFPRSNCNIRTARDFKIYPIPSDGELNVEYKLSDNSNLENGISRNSSIIPEFKIMLYNRDQTMVRTKESILSKIKLDTKGLQSGTYFLHIHFEKEVIISQIIIK